MTDYRNLIRVGIHLVYACSLLASAASAAGSSVDPGKLPDRVQQLLLRHKVPTTSLSVFVQEVASAEPLLSVAADVPRNPASAIKLLTTLVGLHELGPAFSWTTSALVTGSLDDGRLDGDLYLRGGGDPFLVTERFWKFLLELRQAGLQHIAGDLVIDNGYFDPPPGNPGAFDGRPYRPYNVLPAATLVNFGATRFWLVPDLAANRVDIAADPPSSTLVIDNQLILTNSDCSRGPGYLGFRVLDSLNGGHVRFTGRYSARCGRYSLTRAVSSDAAHVFGSFEAMWSSLGGTLTGGLRQAATPDSAQLLHTFKSPPVAEVIRPINKFSNNVMSRQLLLTLGAEVFEPPGTLTKGRDAIQHWLSKSGLTFPELFVDNGAGLSRDTRICAGNLGRLLLAAYRSALMPEFVASLPLSAVDGTLKKRFNGHAIAGRLHMKTGTIDDVRAMGGYLVARDQRTYVVVSLQNYPGIQNGIGTDIQDALLKWLFDR